jgi:DNA polymerase-1
MQHNVLAFDFEHSSNVFKPWDTGFYVACLGIVRSDGVREVIWFDHSSLEYNKDLDDNNPWERVREHLEWADIVVAHNAKHDVTIARYYGISFEKVKLHCTMLVEYLLSGQDTRRRTFGLSEVAAQYGFPPKIDKVKALWDSGVDTWDIDSGLLTEYCLDDCQKTLDIYMRQVEEVAKWNMGKVVDLQNEFTLCLSDMELFGFGFDKDRAEQIVADYEVQMDRLLEIIHGLAVWQVKPNEEATVKFNPGSPQQVSGLLFGGTFKVDGLVWTTRELKHETKLYQKQEKIEVTMDGLGFKSPSKHPNEDGSWPTDKDTLKRLRGRTPEQKLVLSTLAEYANMKKAKETLKGKTVGKGIIYKIKHDGNVRPNFNQCVATTGRLTSSDPNGQNMPRGSTSPLKTCIVPNFDYILQVDLSQIEWRAAAWLSQDKVMIHEINSGIDQHNKACVELMELPLTKENRTHAKVFNFRMLYGGVAYGYFMDQKMPNFPLKKWEEIVHGFEAKYYGLCNWQYNTHTQVMMNGGWVQIPTGRKFNFLPDSKGEFPIRNIKNYPVQGIAGGDILPILAVQIRRGLNQQKMKSRFILTVHDSLVFDVKEEEREALIKLISVCVQNLRRTVGAYYGFDWNVDLTGEIEIGKNYGELEEVPLAA